MTGPSEVLLFVAGVALLGLVFLLAVLISARRAEARLGRTMTVASAIVSKGLASMDDFDAPDAMLAELAKILDADSRMTGDCPFRGPV